MNAWFVHRQFVQGLNQFQDRILKTELTINEPLIFKKLTIKKNLIVTSPINITTLYNQIIGVLVTVTQGNAHC